MFPLGWDTAAKALERGRSEREVEEGRARWWGLTVVLAGISRRLVGTGDPGEEACLVTLAKACSNAGIWCSMPVNTARSNRAFSPAVFSRPNMTSKASVASLHTRIKTWPIISSQARIDCAKFMGKVRRNIISSPLMISRKKCR